MSARHSPDERLFAVSANDGFAVWEIASGKLLFSGGGKHSWITGLAFLDEKRLISSGRNLSDEKGTEEWIVYWDVTSAKIVRRLSLGRIEGRLPECMAISPDARFVISAFSVWGSSPGYVSPVYLWDTVTGKKLYQVGGVDIGTDLMMFSPDSRMLITSSWQSPLQLWEVTTGQERVRIPEQETKNWRSAAISSNGTWLASADDKGVIHVWDLSNGKLIYTFRGHDGAVACLAFSPDSKHLASGSEDGTILIWDLGSV